MRWLIACIFLTSIMACFCTKLISTNPVQPELKLRLNRSHPICVGLARVGMTENEIHQLLGQPEMRFGTMEVFSDQPSLEGPWRVTFENHIAVDLDNGQLIQDGQVLLSVGDDETKMLHILGKPDEEGQQDELRFSNYQIHNSIVRVRLGGYSESPNAVNWISASLKRPALTKSSQFRSLIHDSDVIVPDTPYKVDPWTPKNSRRSFTGSTFLKRALQEARSVR